MASSISGLASVQPADPPAPAPAAAKTAPPSQTSAQPQQSTDTVTLSQTAQVIQLSEEGKTPPQIAAQLGIPLSTVNSDLQTAASATGQPAGASAATPPASCSS